MLPRRNPVVAKYNHILTKNNRAEKVCFGAIRFQFGAIRFRLDAIRFRLVAVFFCLVAVKFRFDAVISFLDADSFCLLADFLCEHALAILFEGFCLPSWCDLSPVVEVGAGFYAVLSFFVDAGEEVEACELFHLVDGADVIAHGVLLGIVVIDEGYASLHAFVEADDGLEEFVGDVQAALPALWRLAGEDGAADDVDGCLVVAHESSAEGLEMLPVFAVEGVGLGAYVGEDE